MLPRCPDYLPSSRSGRWCASSTSGRPSGCRRPRPSCSDWRRWPRLGSRSATPPARRLCNRCSAWFGATGTAGGAVGASGGLPSCGTGRDVTAADLLVGRCRPGCAAGNLAGVARCGCAGLLDAAAVGGGGLGLSARQPAPGCGRHYLRTLVALSRLVGDRAGRHFERSPTSPDVYPAPGSDLPLGQTSQALRRGIARWRAFAAVFLVYLFYAVQDLVLGHSALTIAVGLTLLGAFVGLYLGPLPLGMFGHSPRAKHWAGYRSACPCSRAPTCSSPAAAAWCSWAVFLSEGTVRNYLSSAIAKTAACNRVEALRTAEAQGWLQRVTFGATRPGCTPCRFSSPAHEPAEQVRGDIVTDTAVRRRSPPNATTERRCYPIEFDFAPTDCSSAPATVGSGRWHWNPSRCPQFYAEVMAAPRELDRDQRGTLGSRHRPGTSSSARRCRRWPTSRGGPKVGGQGGVRKAGHLHREQPVQHRVEAADVDGTAPCTRTHVLRIGRPSDRNRAVHRSPPGTLTGDVMPRLTRPCGATSTSGARAWSELVRGRTCPATTRSSTTRCTPWRASPRWRTALATVRKP